jgi:hypothetical protein
MANHRREVHPRIVGQRFLGTLAAVTRVFDQVQWGRISPSLSYLTRAQRQGLEQGRLDLADHPDRSCDLQGRPVGCKPPEPSQIVGIIRLQLVSDKRDDDRREREAERAARKVQQSRVNSAPFPTISELYRMRYEAEWNAQAAVEAFFSWTEHAFIHIAILLGRVLTGDEVAKLAEADWKAKYKAALDLDDLESKHFYDELLDIRAQMRNFMAHGAFGKRGQAFSFHSGAGAVPVLVTHRMRHRYSLTGKQAFDEESALATLGDFLVHLWSGPRAPAQLWLESTLPTILSYGSDGTYRRAMSSLDSMKELVKREQAGFDRAVNMDW